MDKHTKKEESTDLIQQCIKDNTLVYAFVIANDTVDEFAALVKEKNLKECSVLVSLVNQWIQENREA
ncbi:hypothetical protein [Endozoicomonas atrinae]|uniref:hypothetical protein n=1 Tax=Endozoicomonas atrinae TaxID=1333660 RepID=UPI003B002E03